MKDHFPKFIISIISCFCVVFFLPLTAVADDDFEPAEDFSGSAVQSSAPSSASVTVTTVVPYTGRELLLGKDWGEVIHSYNCTGRCGKLYKMTTNVSTHSCTSSTANKAKNNCKKEVTEGAENANPPPEKDCCSVYINEGENFICTCDDCDGDPETTENFEPQVSEPECYPIYDETGVVKKVEISCEAFIGCKCQAFDIHGLNNTN